MYCSLPGLPPLPARRARTRRPLRDPADGSRTEVGSEVFEPESVTSVIKIVNILHSTTRAMRPLEVLVPGGGPGAPLSGGWAGVRAADQRQAEVGRVRRPARGRGSCRAVVTG